MTEAARPSRTGTAHIEAQTDLTAKVFVWGELHAGDCQQDNGRITFWSDGTGWWSCTTLTYHTHTGDIWHARFTAKSSAGVTLFETPTFDSPRMDDGNPPPRYNWSAPFVFEPDWFEAIGGVSQHYR